MARLIFGGTLADFAVALGASVEIPDSSPPADGRPALIPEVAVTLEVYEAPNGSQVTDLQTDGGLPITELTTSTDAATLGTIPRFLGPDGWDADLYVTADGENFMRVPPSTDELHERVTTVEGALTAVQTGNLRDWDNTGRVTGNVPIWDNAAGKWKPGSAGTGSVSSVAGVSPVGGNVPLTPSDIGAGTASGQAALAAIAVAVLKQVGSGYPARPSTAQVVIYIGTATPVTGVGPNDIWLQPVVTS